MKERDRILRKINQSKAFKSIKLDSDMIKMKLTPSTYNISQTKTSLLHSVISKK